MRQKKDSFFSFYFLLLAIIVLLVSIWFWMYLYLTKINVPLNEIMPAIVLLVHGVLEVHFFFLLYYEVL